VFFLLYACVAPHEATPPTTPGPTLRERFGEHAFLTPIDAPATVALVAGGELPSSAVTCGGCHTDHHAEWSMATHSQAITDLQYIAELAKPGQPRWLCLNCHAPTTPQRPESFSLESRLVDGITRVESTPNPTFDPSRVAEGIGCATCHVRRDADGAGLIIGPRGSGRAPHRVKVDREALTGICVRCHSPTGPAGEPIVISPTFPCWFETKQEMTDVTQTCTECHMPAMERPAAAGGPPVQLARHVWRGGGVPKRVSGYDDLAKVEWQTGLDVTVEPGPVIHLTNARANHSLPTADPERFLRVEARLLSGGVVVSRDVLRIGQTWDWGDATTGRLAHRLADTRLRGGETRTWTPRLTGAGDLVVEVAHVRLSADNAAYLATITLDEELRALWPEAVALLPRMDQEYPLATWIYRQEVPLAGAPRTWTAAELIAESKAFAAVPLADKRVRLTMPAE
jgi:hypothetical protein